MLEVAELRSPARPPRAHPLKSRAAGSAQRGVARLVGQASQEVLHIEIQPRGAQLIGYRVHDRVQPMAVRRHANFAVAAFQRDRVGIFACLPHR